MCTTMGFNLQNSEDVSLVGDHETRRVYGCSPIRTESRDEGGWTFECEGLEIVPVSIAGRNAARQSKTHRRVGSPSPAMGDGRWGEPSKFTGPPSSGIVFCNSYPSILGDSEGEKGLGGGSETTSMGGWFPRALHQEYLRPSQRQLVMKQLMKGFSVRIVTSFPFTLNPVGFLWDVEGRGV